MEDEHKHDDNESVDPCEPPPLRFNLSRNFPTHIEQVYPDTKDQLIVEEANEKHSWDLYVSTESNNRCYYVKWQRRHPTTRMESNFVFRTGQRCSEDALYRAKLIHENDTRSKNVDIVDPDLLARSMRNLRNRIAREADTSD